MSPSRADMNDLYRKTHVISTQKHWPTLHIFGEGDLLVVEMGSTVMCCENGGAWVEREYAALSDLLQQELPVIMVGGGAFKYLAERFTSSTTNT